MEDCRELKIFAADGNIKLAKRIADNLNLKLSASKITKFSDGEVYISINESVRGADCFIVQPTCTPVNENLMELLIMADALKRASAGRITAVLPYFGYARQDRKAKPRDPITSKLVTNLMMTSGIDRILMLELHTIQIQGFFEIPVDHITTTSIFAEHIKNNTDFNAKYSIILAPDLGSVSRARRFSKMLNCEVAITDKRRPKANVSEVMNIIGNVKGKKVIIIDDMVDTAGTICNAAKAAIEIGGAREVCAYATHAVLSGDSVEKINNSHIDKITFLNTIEIPEEKMSEKFSVLDVSKTISEAIEIIHANKTVDSDILE